ncbi:MAG: molybdopterin-dependent oxidoreductase [Anaerolineae bacterium]|nr:molybdopterin-dependent oxidoreductase [Anaerolineae bacterium]
MVHLTIDGKHIEVPEGTTVLRAAQQAGIHIPTLCDHPHLTPYGGCRLCLVDVKGARTLQPSCTLPATEGLEVTTVNEQISDARKFVLSMIFSERNHFCPYCQVSGGDCELQNAAYEQGMTHWMIQPNWNTYKVDASNPYFSYEANRCILCRRCVRTCQELVGNFTLGVEQRGAASILVADLGVPLGESTCVSCGMCVQNCPTGAMMDRRAAYRGLSADAETIKTICTGCSVGCGIEVTIRDNNIIAINGDYDSPVNQGVICKIGRWQSLEAMDSGVAVKTPMIRKNGELVSASWEEALAFASKAIDTTRQSLAALASSSLSVETLYAFKKLFVDGLAIQSVSASEMGKYTNAQKSLAVTNGVFEGHLSALNNADCVVTIGEDLIHQHEVVGFMIKRNLPKGTALICVDTDGSAYGNLPNSVIKINPGTEQQLVKGLIAGMVKLGVKSCACDGCKNPDQVVQDAANATGVESTLILDAAYILGNAQSPVIVYGSTVTSDVDASTLTTIKCLSDMISAEMISVKGNANSVASAQFGLDQPVDMHTAKAAVIVLGDKQPCDELLNAVSKVNTKIVFSAYQNALVETADVVFPVNNWAEEEGHFINMDGTVQKRSQILAANGQGKASAQAIHDLAAQLGFSIDDHWMEALQSTPASVTIA